MPSATRNLFVKRFLDLQKLLLINSKSFFAFLIDLTSNNARTQMLNN
jgi:hypothetical protein